MKKKKEQKSTSKRVLVELTNILGLAESLITVTHLFHCWVSTHRIAHFDVHRKTGARMSTEALFTKVPNWKPLECPSKERRSMYHGSDTMEDHTVTKRNKLQPNIITWKNHKDIILNERSQTR